VAKHKSLAKLRDDAAVLLQRLVRLKAAVAADQGGYIECVTCGVWKLWNKGMQGGHYVSRVNIKHKILEENVHPQCQRCNGPRGGANNEYSLYMIDMYGREFVDELIATQNDGCEMKRPDIEAVIVDLKSQIKELEQQL
jgi:hypothetical protein